MSGIDLDLTFEQRLRWQRAAPFVAVGAGSVVLGGLVAAVTGPAGWEHGSWAAAYLVLVTGVAQIGLGGGQAVLGRRPPARGLVTAQVSGWNLAGVLVIVGTLVAAPWLVAVGGALLVMVLVLLSLGVRGSGHGRWLWLYLGLVLVLLVSIPVGLVLAATRP